MGFNLSGIVVNKNYENNLKSLQAEFGWNLQFIEEIDFETASSNWKDEGICDIYFSEKGTLLFVSMDLCIDSWSIKDGNTLTFALSETSMAFNLNYCEGKTLKRSFMQVNDDRMTDEGEKLAIEQTEEDVSEIIWTQLGVVLGKQFWNIEPGEKAFRYHFVPAAKPAIEEKPEMLATIKTTVNVAPEIKKPWWKFWS